MNNKKSSGQPFFGFSIIRRSLGRFLWPPLQSHFDVFTTLSRFCSRSCERVASFGILIKNPVFFIWFIPFPVWEFLKNFRFVQSSNVMKIGINCMIYLFAHFLRNKIILLKCNKSWLCHFISWTFFMQSKNLVFTKACNPWLIEEQTSLLIWKNIPRK